LPLNVALKSLEALEIVKDTTSSDKPYGCVDTTSYAGWTILRCAPQQETPGYRRAQLSAAHPAISIGILATPEQLHSHKHLQMAARLLESGSADIVVAEQPQTGTTPRYPLETVLAGEFLSQAASLEDLSEVAVDRTGLSVALPSLMEQQKHAVQMFEVPDISDQRRARLVANQESGPITVPGGTGKQITWNPYPAVEVVPTCKNTAGKAADCAWRGWFSTESDSGRHDRPPDVTGLSGDRWLLARGQWYVEAVIKARAAEWDPGTAPPNHLRAYLAQTVLTIGPEGVSDVLQLGRDVATVSLRVPAGLTATLDKKAWDGSATDIPLGEHEVELYGGCYHWRKSFAVVAEEATQGEKYRIGKAIPYAMATALPGYPQI
jgi:hypothetical protein